MNQTDIINPVRTVVVRGENVEVKELTWKNYLRAIKELTGSLIEFVGDGKTLEINKDKLIAIIMKSEVFIEFVIVNSVQGKDAEWVNGLTAREILPIINAVVELNASEEVVGAGKQVADQIRQVFERRKTALAPSTSS